MPTAEILQSNQIAEHTITTHFMIIQWEAYTSLFARMSERFEKQLKLSRGAAKEPGLLDLTPEIKHF